jgi:tol-pal system protein YbgF
MMRPMTMNSARSGPPRSIASVLMASGPLASACVVAALLIGTGASAQSRLSLADRVAALETRMQQNQTEQSVEQLNRIAQLESDVKALRSLIEQMQNENEELKQRDKAQYIDLDTRLSRIENAGPTTPAPAARPAASTRVPVAAPAASGPAAVLPPSTSAANANGAPTAPANPADEQAAYKTAFDTMKAEQYADSANRFNTFVQQYPNSTLAPNAYYWMGESYYVTQNYQLALEAFKTVVTKYPDSPKTPGALLKLGFSQDGLKQRDAAQATLREVIQKYPNSNEATEAQGRLRAMSMDTSGG